MRTIKVKFKKSAAAIKSLDDICAPVALVGKTTRVEFKHISEVFPGRKVYLIRDNRPDIGGWFVYGESFKRV